MVETGVALFTVGVFHDLAWAQKGLDALMQAGFPVESLTVLAKDSPDAVVFIQRVLGAPPERIDLAGIGVATARGSLLPLLQGDGGHDLAKLGLAGTMRRAGFQAHDARIFDALTARGGVLVAIQGDPRAADALAILHSYGGGNAAIGAWAGRG